MKPLSDPANTHRSFWRIPVGERVLSILGFSYETNDNLVDSISENLAKFLLNVAKVSELQDHCIKFCHISRNYYNESATFVQLLEDETEQHKLSSKLSSAAILESIDMALSEFVERPFQTIKHHTETINALIEKREELQTEFWELKKRYDAGKREEVIKYDAVELSLKEQTDTLLAHMDAFEQTLPQLRRRVLAGISAIQHGRSQMVRQAIETSNLACDPLAVQILAVIKTYAEIVANRKPLAELAVPDTFQDFEKALQVALATRRGVFGVDLSSLEGIPSVMLKTIAFLDKHGLQVEGIFRVPGDEDRVQALRSSFHCGKDVDLEAPIRPLSQPPSQQHSTQRRCQVHATPSELEVTDGIPEGHVESSGGAEHVADAKDVDTAGSQVESEVVVENEDSDGTCCCTAQDAASLLKLFLRQLPHPLIPREHYHDLLDVGSGPAEEFSAAVGRLMADGGFPQANRSCLKLLLALLVKVVQNAETNRMTADNLAVVFAPTIMAPPVMESPQLKDTHRTIAFIKRLIQQAETLFGDDIWVDYPCPALLCV